DAARASGSEEGTRRPGVAPRDEAPSASRTPPTSVARTGMPRARASLATMPYVSWREGRARRAAPAYAGARAGPVSAPARVTRSSRPALQRADHSPVACEASAEAPTRLQVHRRSATRARAETRTSWPLIGVIAPTDSNRSPAGEPSASGDLSAPGTTTCSRAAGTPQAVASQ